MMVDVDNTYELWDLEKPVLTPCSHLFHLEPIGVGTSYVESLTGYIARLAEAHCVILGKLIFCEIAPLIKEGYVFDSSKRTIDSIVGDNKVRRALNGRGLMATTLIQALEALTLHDNLRFLTMLTWSDVLPSLGLLRTYKAWCPICYQQWRTAGQIVYEPLIWALDTVEVCPQHHRHLQTQCPLCHNHLPLLPWQCRAGCCSSCGNWLGISLNAEALDSEIWGEDELKWQLWAVDKIGDLLAAAPHLSCPPPRERIKKAISACVNQVTEGNITAFSKLIGTCHRALTQWCAGETIPKFSTILQICYCLGMSPLDFLTEEVVAVDSSRLVKLRQSWPKRQPPSPRIKFHLNTAQAMLFAALEEVPPPSVNEVRRRLGYKGSSQLYRHFPDVCRTISSRYAEYKRTKSIEEMQRSLEAVLESDEFPPPSIQEVARRIKRHSSFLYRNCSDLCHAISARYMSYCKATRIERIEQLRQEVKQLAFELHAKGVAPNGFTVGKLMTRPGTMRLKEVYTVLREVRRELGYEK